MITHAHPHQISGAVVSEQANDDLVHVEDIVDATRTVARHKYRILISIAVALVLGWLYLRQQPVVYQSKSKLLVEVQKPIDFSGVSSQIAADENTPATQMLLIKSPWLLGEAIESHQLADLSTFAEVGDPVNYLSGALNVAYEDGVFMFAVQSSCAQDCPLVLDAVMATFKDYLHESESSRSEGIIDSITKKAREIHEELRQWEAEYEKLRETAPVQSVEDLEFSASTHQLARLEAKRVDLLVQHAEVTSRLAAVSKAMDDDGIAAAASLIPPSFKEQQARSVASITRQHERLEDKEERQEFRTELRQQQSFSRLRELTEKKRQLLESKDAKLFPLLIEERQLSASYLPGFPKLKEVQDQIDLARGMFDDSIKQVQDELTDLQIALGVDADGLPLSSVAGSGENAAVGFDEKQLAALVRDYVQSLTQQSKEMLVAKDTLAGQFRILNEELRGQRERVREISMFDLKSERFQNNIRRAERLHDTLVAQLSSLDVSKDYGGYRATVIADPTNGYKVSPNSRSTLFLAGILGLLCGLMWSGWVQLFGKTFHRPEAVKSLGLPLLGQVPVMSPFKIAKDETAATDQTDPLLCTYRDPDSIYAEAYRSLRTCLSFCNHGDHNMVIQITSPTAGDGKSTLAANLAVSIAQSGKRVLLVDADLRHPTVHRIFHCGNDVGLSSVLCESVESREVIQPSGIPGLYLLPSGPVTGCPSDLLASPCFGEFLDCRRKKFDFVMVDSPPLLATSEASVIASLSDGVVLTLRPSRGDQIPAQRARQMLEMADANILGVVVNATKSKMDDYYRIYNSGTHNRALNWRRSPENEPVPTSDRVDVDQFFADRV